jgi:hypothetical protein
MLERFVTGVERGKRSQQQVGKGDALLLQDSFRIYSRVWQSSGPGFRTDEAAIPLAHGGSEGN